MPQIALATYDQNIDFAPSDALTVKALQTLGAQAQMVVWNDADQDWRQFDLVVIRSTWDYHDHVGEFRDWINQLEMASVPLYNPPDILRWNMDKNYLAGLEAIGVCIPQTRYVPGGSSVSLFDLVDPTWAGAVLKPAVSASAHDTYQFKAAEADRLQSELDRILIQKDALIQEFMPEIQDEGEWSLMFFNKAYSHAVLKKPKVGDFRVQIQYGGEQTGAKAPRPLVEQAQAILDAIPEPLLYARVDVVNRGGQLVLMELELIEPYLFLEYAEGAPARFAEALLSVC
jgi:glutathione synthase/RimK-type ligase-like ATP-grasp enzyme